MKAYLPPNLILLLTGANKWYIHTGQLWLSGFNFLHYTRCLLLGGFENYTTVNNKILSPSPASLNPEHLIGLKYKAAHTPPTSQ